MGKLKSRLSCVSLCRFGSYFPTKSNARQDSGSSGKLVANAASIYDFAISKRIVQPGSAAEGKRVGERLRRGPKVSQQQPTEC